MPTRASFGATPLRAPRFDGSDALWHDARAGLSGTSGSAAIPTYVKVALLVVVLALGMLTNRGQPANAWTAPAALNTNADSDSAFDDDRWPEVTTDGAGNWVAVWYSNDDLGGTIGTDWDILVARSTDNGATWTDPFVLNTNAATDSGGDQYPVVTTDGAGNWVAAWYSTENLGGIGTDWDILVAHSTDNGATWTDPVALNTNAATDSGDDYQPQMTTDGAGNWVAVWYSNDDLGGTIGTDVDILAARSTDNGATWTDPVAPNTNAATDSGGDYYPEVTTDGAGNWVAVWQSNENLDGIGTDIDILVARSIDNGATWANATALNTNAATDSGDDYQPQMTTDGAGNWVAVWQSNENLDGIGADIDILVARSTDNGATWTDPAALNTNAATDSGGDYQPQMRTGGGGNWVAVWQSDENLDGIGTDWDILVARSTDNGVTWTDPVALNTNAATDSGDDYQPQLTTDGTGNWVAVWESDDEMDDTIGTDWDIHYATEYIPQSPPVGGIAEYAAMVTTLTLEPDGSRPVALAVNSSSDRIYVADAGSDSVAVIDGASKSLIATIPVGRAPHAVAVNPLANRVYVANKESNDVTVIDGESHEVITTVAVREEPWDLAVDPNTGRVFVSNYRGGTVSVIDGRRNSVIHTVSGGKLPTGVVVNPETGRVYVVSSASGHLRVIDGVSNLLIATLPVTGGSTAKAWDVAVDGGSSRLYVGTSAGETSGASVGTVAVVDTSTNSLINPVSVPGPVEVLAIDPAGDRIYAASHSDNHVWVIDGRSGLMKAAVRLGSGVSAMDIDSASGRIYVAHSEDASISIVSWRPGVTLTPGWTYACYLGEEKPLDDALEGTLDTVSAVYRLGPNGGYDRWFPNRPGLSTIAAVRPNQALFILAEDYTSWPQELSEAGGDLTLVPGWNSTCYLGETKESTGAVGEVGDSIAVAYSLAPDGTWRRFVPGRPDLTNMSEVQRLSPLIVLVPSPGEPEVVKGPTPPTAPGGEKKFVLTFDDSDGSGVIVSQILDTLAQYGAKAIFFPTASWAAGNPLIDRMWAEGHLVCNHTYSHAYLTLLSAEGIRSEILSGAGVGKCNLLRPPYGAHNSRVDSIAASLGYSIYMWDVDPWDWSGTSVSYIISNILNNAHPGAVVVLHMHAYNTMIALPRVIEGLQAAGYVLSY